MTVPALLVDFPPPSSPEHSARATLLGRQWPLCWAVGNTFFRPISTLGAIGYAFSAYQASQSLTAKGDWRLFAFAAFLHVTNIIHSAVNMQPINDKLTALATPSEKGQMGAEALARSWAKGNLLRVICPVIAGTIALWQTVA